MANSGLHVIVYEKGSAATIHTLPYAPDVVLVIMPRDGSYAGGQFIIPQGTTNDVYYLIGNELKVNGVRNGWWFY